MHNDLALKSRSWRGDSYKYLRRAKRSNVHVDRELAQEERATRPRSQTIGTEVESEGIRPAAGSLCATGISHHRGLHHNCAAYYGPSYIAHFAITFPIHIHERPSPRRRWPLYYSIHGEPESLLRLPCDSRRLGKKYHSLRRSRASFLSDWRIEVFVSHFDINVMFHRRISLSVSKSLSSFTLGGKKGLGNKKHLLGRH